jgi:hypothetical protein
LQIASIILHVKNGSQHRRKRPIYNQPHPFMSIPIVKI